MVFIVQRPDALIFRPFVEVDPKFAELLRRAARAGIGIIAMSTEFRPPKLYLVRGDLPVQL